MNKPSCARSAVVPSKHFARLGAEHRSEIFRHLIDLDAGGRALRFGVPTRDDAIARYVATIDFEHDIVEGVWEEDRLVGVAHLAVYSEDSNCVGELGISVSAEARHQHHATIDLESAACASA